MLVNAKTGVQTWSKAQQTSGLKSDGSQSASSEDFKKYYGDKNIGDVLNQITDPNYVEPEKRIRAVGNQDLDKNAFMKMMLAQLKNQDPTNPLQSHEMAAQLAQFTSVEQLSNMNETLRTMKNAQDPMAGFQALNFIGKSVAGDSSKLYRNTGDKNHDLVFDLPKPASEVTIVIKDANGDVARKYELKNLKSGQNKVAWNGLLENGASAREGEYAFEIEAKDGHGKKIAVKTSFEGAITGVNYTPQGPMLLIGNKSVRLSDVKKIVDGTIKQNDQNVRDVTSLDLAKEKSNEKMNKEEKVSSKESTTSAETKQDETKSSEEKSSDTKLTANQTKLMDNVAMSRGMIDKVKKETKTE